MSGNYRKLSSHAALPNENIVGYGVIDAANDAMNGNPTLFEMYTPERGVGGVAAQVWADAVCEQLHHKVMYAPVTKIMGEAS